MSQLKREVGVGGAVMLGLGSIVGTGVFVSIGVAAGVTGPSVILAIAVAALVAMCNAFSSAQLAASHPVSGGTYEYGYKYLTPAVGFTAGWMFMLAKSASAATAALGFSGYLLHVLDIDMNLVPVALAVVVVLTVVVLSGMRRSNAVNIAIVSVTLLSLAVFVFATLPIERSNVEPIVPADGRAWLEACALMFVAYTGYGRIATLGEEVKEPRRSIPRAIVITLIVTALLYMAVGIAAVGAQGADALVAETQAAPLEVVAPGNVKWIVAVGAVTAMAGVLLNLILGLSRVLLAMGRRGDMPAATANLNVSIVIVGLIIAGLACLGSVKTTWSFSAFTVLTYYAITNACALKLPPEDRLYPRFLAWCGLAACAFLAFWVQPMFWMVGLGLIAVGLVWHKIRRKGNHEETKNTKDHEE